MSDSEQHEPRGRTFTEATAPGESRVSVRGLWKLYGPHPPEITPELAAKSKAELLEDTGTVLALKDVSFDVAAGETFVVMGLTVSALVLWLRGSTGPEGR